MEVPGPGPGTVPDALDQLTYFLLATTRRGGTGIFLLGKLRHGALQ